MSDLIAKIEKYFRSISRYPLLVVVPPDEYNDVLAAFSGVHKLRVSDYCVGADKEPDIEQLQEDVRGLIGNNILLGLGDYLASKSSIAKTALLPYKALALRDNSHIAILLSPHMYSVVKEIHDSDPRVRSRIVLPQTIPSSKTVDSSVLVYGIKAYLEACEKGEHISSVKTNLNISNVNVINPESAYDELKHKFPNEFGKLSREFGTASNWGKLLGELNHAKKTILQYFETRNYASPEYIFLKYAKRNDYEAWLYFIYLKLSASNNGYLGVVVAKAKTLEDLLGSAKTAILDFHVEDREFEDYYLQRKIMLHDCADVDMADYKPKIILKGDSRIAYLTDNTKIERQAVIESLCEGAKDDSLSIVYHDLYLYLKDFQFEDDRFTNYFAKYKRCKLKNNIDDDFLVTVANYASSRPYNSLPSRSSLIGYFDDGSTTLIFLDAFGVEYLGYVKEKCSELKLRFAAKIARAELPSVTAINRKFYDEWKGNKETPIKDLDELKHHPERGYDYNNSPLPIHLAEELDVIKGALERAKTKLNTGECKKVLLASDHGASRLAVISPDVQIPSNACEAKSSGRYCVGEPLPDAPNIVQETECANAIVADYSRFSGSRAASVEVHGGATLEEVLVPIIEITLADNNLQVTLENDVIEVSYKTEPFLVFIITPDCNNVTASIDSKTHPVERLEKSRYKIIVPDLKKGRHRLDVFESQNKIYSQEFTVKSKGFAERDMF